MSVHLYFTLWSLTCSWNEENYGLQEQDCIRKHTQIGLYTMVVMLIINVIVEVHEFSK